MKKTVTKKKVVVTPKEVKKSHTTKTSFWYKVTGGRMK